MISNKNFLLISVIIFFFSFSPTFGQQNDSDATIFKEFSWGKVTALTPTNIEIKGIVWCWIGGSMCYIKNGNLIEKQLIFNNPTDLSNISFIYLADVYINNNERIRYNFDDNQKSIQQIKLNEIIYIGKNKPIFLCNNKLRNDGKLFNVQKFIPMESDLIDLLEIKYCIATTHFTILNRVSYPSVEIIDTVCPTPQDPNLRMQLPFPEEI